MEAPLVQTQLKLAEDPKHDTGLNEVDPSLNIKDKQAQEQDGGKDVADSFDTKATYFFAVYVKTIFALSQES